METLRKKAKSLQDMGEGGDTILAHINPREAALLKAVGGSGKRNPKTGLLSFEMEGDPVYPYVDPYQQAIQQYVAANTTQAGSSLEGDTITAPLPTYLQSGYATDPALVPMQETLSVYNEPLPTAEGQWGQTGGSPREGDNRQFWQTPEDVALQNEWNTYYNSGDTAAQELYKQRYPDRFKDTTFSDWMPLLTDFILPSLGAYGAVSGISSLLGGSTAPAAIGYGSGTPIATTAGDFLSGAELASGAVAPGLLNQPFTPEFGTPGTETRGFTPEIGPDGSPVPGSPGMPPAGSSLSSLLSNPMMLKTLLGAAGGLLGSKPKSSSQTSGLLNYTQRPMIQQQPFVSKWGAPRPPWR